MWGWGSKESRSAEWWVCLSALARVQESAGLFLSTADQATLTGNIPGSLFYFIGQCTPTVLAFLLSCCCSVFYICGCNDSYLHSQTAEMALIYSSLKLCPTILPFIRSFIFNLLQSLGWHALQWRQLPLSASLCCHLVSGCPLSSSQAWMFWICSAGEHFHLKLQCFLCNLLPLWKIIQDFIHSNPSIPSVICFSLSSDTFDCDTIIWKTLKAIIRPPYLTNEPLRQCLSTEE